MATYSPRKLLASVSWMQVAGFGSFRLASFLIVFNPTIYTVFSNPYTHILFYVCFTAVTIGSFFLVMRMPGKALGFLMCQRGKVFVASVIASFSIIVMLAVGLAVGAISMIVFAVTAALLTCIWALYSAGWGLVFLQHHDATISSVQVALAITAEGIFYPLCSRAPVIGQTVLIGLLLIVSATLLARALNGTEAPAPQQRLVLPPTYRKTNLNIIFVSVVLGFLMDFCTKTLPSGNATGDYLDNLGWLLALCYLISATALIIGSCQDKRNPASLLWRLVVLLTIVVFALYALDTFSLSAGFCQQTVAVLFDMMIWVISIQFAEHSKESTFYLTSYLKLYYLLGALAGSAIGSIVLAVFDIPSLLILAVLAVITVAIYLFKLDGHDLDAIIKSYSDSVKQGTHKRVVQRIAQAHHLTERESEVLELMVQGRSNDRIASKLYLAIGTVNVHQYHIFQKLGVHNRQELIDLYDKEQRTS